MVYRKDAQEDLTPKQAAIPMALGCGGIGIFPALARLSDHVGKIGCCSKMNSRNPG